jgi:hypothetical protein
MKFSYKHETWGLCAPKKYLSMDKYKIKAQTPRRKSNITLSWEKIKLLKLTIESQLGIY